MPKQKWTFITNHAAVLTLLDHEDNPTARQIARTIDVTERTVIRIIKDLETAGYITKTRVGRENRYTVHTSLPLRRSDQREVHVRDLLQLISKKV